MTRPSLVAPFFWGLLGLLLVPGLLLVFRPADASHAGGMSAMSIDMDTAGNSATALGTLESCVAASPGSSLTFDVTATDIPASDPMVAFAFTLNYPASVATVSAAEHVFLLGSTPGSNLFNASESIPDSDGSYFVGVADLSDIITVLPEQGSGVLSRITLAIDAGATPGVYGLALSEAAHIDPDNSGFAPDVLNNAFIAVSDTCDNLPTPSPPAVTPTPGPPTPTPPPGEGVLGFDHDGLPLDINFGPATVAPGGAITVPLVAQAPPAGLGGWEVTVAFDMFVLDATGCGAVGGICNPDFGPAEVKFVGTALPGLEGTVTLGDVTFQAIGVAGACSALGLLDILFFDGNGDPASPTALNGLVCLEDGGGPCGYIPVNDDIDDAQVIPEAPFLWLDDTTCATTAPDDPFCSGNAHSVWFSFTALRSGPLRVDTFGSGFDTTLSAYTGSRGALTQVACNDDSGSLQSEIEFPVEAGETYSIMVGSFGLSPGGFLVLSLDYRLELGVTIDPRASVIAKDGVATVRGSVTCTTEADVLIAGTVRQRAGRVYVEAPFEAELLCTGYGSWEATTGPGNGRFAGGHAQVGLDAAGFSFSDFVMVHAEGDVRLQGTRPPRDERCPRDRNLGFESGVVDSSAIPCWTTAVIGNGGWCTQAGTLAPGGDCFGSPATVAAPPEGAQAAMTGQLGPGGRVMYQCGTLRSGSISFQLYINNLAIFVTQPTLDPNISYANQQVRVDLMSAAGMASDPFTTAAGDVLMNLYQTQPGDPLESGYDLVTADAGAYVGQDVCLRFAEVDNLFYQQAGVDDVRIALR